jgi:hypothetical protein
VSNLRIVVLALALVGGACCAPLRAEDAPVSFTKDVAPILGAGAVSLGVATALYLRRKSQVSMALGVGMSGTSVIAYGGWP